MPLQPAILRGALAGALATLPMTAVIAAGRAARWLWTPPPVEITARAEARAGLGRLPAPAFRATWLAAHFGYGAVAGAGYALVRRVLPRSTWFAGLIYGGAVWGLSYLGLMPGLGLYPWPREDTEARLAVMLAAHGVYGLVTAEAERRL